MAVQMTNQSVKDQAKKRFQLAALAGQVLAQHGQAVKGGPAGGRPVMGGPALQAPQTQPHMGEPQPPAGAKGTPTPGRPTAASLTGQLAQAGVKAPWDAARAKEIDAKYGAGASDRRARRLAKGIKLGPHATGGGAKAADAAGLLHGKLPVGMLAGGSPQSGHGGYDRGFDSAHPSPQLAALAAMLEEQHNSAGQLPVGHNVRARERQVEQAQHDGAAIRVHRRRRRR